jgi:hypothetical protein
MLLTGQVVATDDLVLRAVAGQCANGMGFLTAHMLLEEISIAYRYIALSILKTIP